MKIARGYNIICNIFGSFFFYINKETDDTLNFLNHQLTELKKILIDKEHTFKSKLDVMAKEKLEYEQILNE